MTDIPDYNEKRYPSRISLYVIRAIDGRRTDVPGDVCSAPTVSRLPGDPEILMQMYKLY